MIFFFNDTATTEIYTLSLHDALPIYLIKLTGKPTFCNFSNIYFAISSAVVRVGIPYTFELSSVKSWATLLSFSLCRSRSEEHTSELQSRQYLVCRLLLEKKKHVY